MTAWKPIVLIAVMLTVSGPVLADRHTPTLPKAKMAKNGMYAQEWLYKSALNLQEDLTTTQRQGKRLVILWEQPDCLYCQPMYEINLRIPRLVDKIKNNFNVIKLNILGDRKIFDLDGKALTEMEFAGKYEIRYTPTLQFLPESLAKAAGKVGKDLDVFRPEGYFKPFHFYFLFHYVQSKGYESQPNFQRWLGAIGLDMQAKNIKYDLWVDALPLDLPNEY